MKINSVSIGKGNVEYIIAQIDYKFRHQKCDFHLSTHLRIYLSYSYTRRKEYFADLSCQNTCLENMQKVQKLITNLIILWLVNVGGA